jgi:predicted nucleotidyltransferase
MNELRKKRNKLNITQLQAANACGVSLRTYQTYEETDTFNSTYDELIKKLDEIGIPDGSNHIISVRFIKHVCRQFFSEKYPEVKCAYLYGSYARGEASGKSDVDILVILEEPLGLRIFGIADELEQLLHKEVDLQSYESLVDNAAMLKDILVEGIRIYG